MLLLVVEAAEHSHLTLDSSKFASTHLFSTRLSNFSSLSLMSSFGVPSSCSLRRVSSKFWSLLKFCVGR